MPPVRVVADGSVIATITLKLLKEDIGRTSRGERTARLLLRCRHPVLSPSSDPALAPEPPACDRILDL